MLTEDFVYRYYCSFKALFFPLKVFILSCHNLFLIFSLMFKLHKSRLMALLFNGNLISCRGNLKCFLLFSYIVGVTVA